MDIVYYLEIIVFMILGIDYGKSKIGLAVADDKKQSAIAIPLKTIRFISKDRLFKEFFNIAKNYHITKVVIGNPFVNREDDKIRKADFDEFRKNIKTVLGLNPEMVDEYLSTRAAKRLLHGLPHQKRADDDAIAAQLILQSYLENVHHA